MVVQFDRLDLSNPTLHIDKNVLQQLKNNKS
jgi:hypothetical protein